MSTIFVLLSLLFLLFIASVFPVFLVLLSDLFPFSRLNWMLVSTLKWLHDICQLCWLQESLDSLSLEMKMEEEKNWRDREIGPDPGWSICKYSQIISDICKYFKILLQVLKWCPIVCPINLKYSGTCVLQLLVGL